MQVHLEYGYAYKSWTYTGKQVIGRTRIECIALKRNIYPTSGSQLNSHISKCVICSSILFKKIKLPIFSIQEIFFSKQDSLYIEWISLTINNFRRLLSIFFNTILYMRKSTEISKFENPGIKQMNRGTFNLASLRWWFFQAKDTSVDPSLLKFYFLIGIFKIYYFHINWATISINIDFMIQTKTIEKFNFFLYEVNWII